MKTAVYYIKISIKSQTNNSLLRKNNENNRVSIKTLVYSCLKIGSSSSSNLNHTSIRTTFGEYSGKSNLISASNKTANNFLLFSDAKMSKFLVQYVSYMQPSIRKGISLQETEFLYSNQDNP